MDNYVWGYLVSIIGGGIFTAISSKITHSLLKKHKSQIDPDIESICWIPVTIGVLERLLITTVVGFNVPGAASFMAAWVAVKALHGWGRSKEDDSIFIRGKLFVGFINSLFSMIFGLAGGLIFKCAS